jgi:aspartyl-tRNA(Asn)/glutamyl-tRNA(Gln) amidotransferase subunit C
MSELTAKDVEHVALLARIALNPGEVERMGHDLSAVLDYVRTLDDLGVEKEAVLSHVHDRFAPARPDEPHQERCLARADVLAQAPEQDGAHFLVPPVVDTR